jgi:glycosyltransferase involved in cell wall biosynthesis
MKFKLICLISCFLAVLAALKWSSKPVHFSTEEFPLSEHKSFVFVIHAYNQEDWCERALLSITSQDYDHFRVVFIDDGSSDATWAKAKAFVEENHQEMKVTLVQNESQLGSAISLYQTVENLLDKEIVIPMSAKDFLTQPDVLQELNQAYQNPSTWLTLSSSLTYPTYEENPDRLISFYAAIFKQIHLVDLMKSSTLDILKELVGSHSRQLLNLHLFENLASLLKRENVLPYARSHYSSLAQFPQNVPSKEKVDILIFSCDRPLQLYGCLESIVRYMKGFETLSVLYRASNDRFASGYELLKNSFPQVHFCRQSSNYKKDFKPLFLKAISKFPSKYILFGVDDIIVKDATDLHQCIEWMEKTGAYGFYLRFGKHISYCYQSGTPQSIPLSIPLKEDIYAWKLDEAHYDWGFPNSLDMTLYRKEDLKEPFEKLNFKAPNSLEFCWARDYRPQGAVGLYFKNSKIVNIPFNVVSKTGNPHMNYLTVDELLVKFEEGLKMDITPLHKILNASPHFEYFPEFVDRN